MKKRIGLAAALLAVVMMSGCATMSTQPHTMLRNGRLYVDGKPVFLKIGKALPSFDQEESVQRLEKGLPILKEKGYTMIELVAYWHHFDKDGDGTLDPEPVARLRRVIKEARELGLFVGLATENYGVGGGTIPPDVFKRNPDIVAVNADGVPVSDTEYGFGSTVPSLYAPAYLEVSRKFIRSVAAAVDPDSILWYETTVEPQYIGNQSIDYGVYARRAYEAWLKKKGISGPAWPERFPVPESFQRNPVWNRFRAEWLADWVNGDAAAFRSIVGKDKLVAVDYLETGGKEMWRRNGDSKVFLRNLKCANIIQVNWHWSLATRAPNLMAYDNVRAVMAETGRDWAVSEHMTLNGSDYRAEEVPAMLRNTLAHGTLLGWEFVNVVADSKDPFVLYNDDWSPKPPISQVDDHWEAWMAEVKKEEQRRQATRGPSR